MEQDELQQQIEHRSKHLTHAKEFYVAYDTNVRANMGDGLDMHVCYCKDNVEAVIVSSLLNQLREKVA